MCCPAWEEAKSLLTGSWVYQVKHFPGRQKIVYKNRTHLTGEKALQLCSTPLREAVYIKEMFSLQRMALLWAQSGCTLGLLLLITWGAHVQTICLCSPCQPHPFIRCSIISSNPKLTVPPQLYNIWSIEYSCMKDNNHFCAGYWSITHLRTQSWTERSFLFL